MNPAKSEIFTQLQREILPLQGYKPATETHALNIGLGALEASFPNGCFPRGAVHEFLCESAEDRAATGGFITGLLSSMMKNGGAAAWISSCRTIFPPALKSFGIDPDRVLFIDVQKESDLLWVMEECLKCAGLAAVIGEVKQFNFTDSRRLQLAVEQSKVTGFILRKNIRSLHTTACISRFKIHALSTELPGGMPGIGFPRWHIELLKVRNGRPGSWQVEWMAGRFRPVPGKLAGWPLQIKSKVG